MKKISFNNLKNLKNSKLGLSSQEVISQRNLFGKNNILEVSGHPLLELMLDTVKDPMIWFLIGVGFVFILTNQFQEGMTLFLAILPLILMDAFLHWRTKSSTEGFKGNLSSEVRVLREGNELIINAQDLVPGDLVFLATESYIPADGIIDEENELQIDESVLTGEAFPIKKTRISFDYFFKVDQDEVSVDEFHLVFAGTRVLSGKGKMRVLFTGTNTAYGEIVQSISQAPHELTPLQKSISQLVKGLIWAAAVFCVILAGVRIYQGHSWIDALLSAATLAVAAIPEEFPVVFTFFLSVGIYRLAKHRALVRRAVSVENIGRITFICTDKTGTITIGKLKLTHLDAVNSEDELLTAAFAASNSEGSDPVDLAINNLAHERNIKPFKVLRRFAFTEDRKKETCIVQKVNQLYAFVKGPPEKILNSSKISHEQKIIWEEKVNHWASDGHKVLAVAGKTVSDSENEPESEFNFLGLLAFEDPARPEVKEAITYCQNNKIKVMMITGDHPKTAAAIAHDIGMLDPVVMTIQDESKLEDPEFLRSVNVMARCTPMQKFKIVTTLKKAGEIVAVTGDGVNDAPALKAADIGMAMGERGTRSAKEVSSIILADDNFKTIVQAIKEGKQLFINLRSSFEYLLLIHLPFILTAAFLPLMGYPLLYLPVHIVWLELIIHPTAILAFQSSAIDHQTLPKIGIFDRKKVIKISLLGFFLTIFMGWSFIKGLQENGDILHARAKVMGILILWSAGIALRVTRFKNKTAWIISSLSIISSVALIQSDALNSIVQLTSLHLIDWIEIGAIVLGPLVFI
jgi:Ca2+-transporting ATPase